MYSIIAIFEIVIIACRPDKVLIAMKKWIHFLVHFKVLKLMFIDESYPKYIP